MASAASSRSGPHAPGRDQSVVLVVEDEMLVRIDVVEHLAGCGLAVRGVASAEEAISQLERDAEVAVVFTDVHLPGDMDGIGLARWMREHRPGVSIVLTSGQADMMAQVNRLCPGQRFIPKPYQMNAIEADIRALLSHRRPDRSQ